MTAIKTKLGEVEAGATPFRPTTAIPKSNVQDAIEALGTPAASSIPIADAGNIITATDVEGALQENRTAIDAIEAAGYLTEAAADALYDALGDAAAAQSAAEATAAAALAAHVAAGDPHPGYLTAAEGNALYDALGAAAAAIAAHESDTTAHPATNIPIADAGGLITATDVEGALAENRAAIDAIEADYLVAADIANMLETGDIGSSVQAYAANLTTWAGLAPSANAQTLVTAADYAAMRALLDLEAGTDFLSPAAIAAAYQPLDANLTTWAGVTPGTGVTTALAVNVGSTGAIVTNGGALGTPSSGTLTNCTGLPVSGIAASTVTALGVGSLNIGHASDTTLARVSAGVLSIEGVTIATASNTLTLTNKTLTAANLGGTTNLSGGQIAFPATQSASAGANTLDDYEEGTWTPTLRNGSGSALTYTTALQETKYTKIGNLVTCTVFIALATYTSSSGTLRIDLPFTATSDANGYAFAMAGAIGIEWSSGTMVGVSVAPSANYATLSSNQDNGASYDIQTTDVAAGDIIAFTFTYWV